MQGGPSLQNILEPVTLRPKVRANHFDNLLEAATDSLPRLKPPTDPRTQQSTFFFAAHKYIIFFLLNFIKINSSAAAVHSAINEAQYFSIVLQPPNVDLLSSKLHIGCCKNSELCGIVVHIDLFRNKHGQSQPWDLFLWYLWIYLSTHRDNSLSYSLTCGGAKIRVLLWSDLGKYMFESFVQQLTNVFAGIIMGFGELWSTPEDILEAISVSFTVEGHPAISAPFHQIVCSVCCRFFLIYQLWYIPLIFLRMLYTWFFFFMLIDYSSGRSFPIKIVIFSINIGLLTPQFKPTVILFDWECHCGVAKLIAANACRHYFNSSVALWCAEQLTPCLCHFVQHCICYHNQKLKHFMASWFIITQSQGAWIRF